MNGNLCLADLPRAGLGNKILTWAHAYVLSDKLELELITNGWVTLHIGPIIRREKSNRFYIGYFKKNDLSTTLRFYFYRFFKEKTSIECSEIHNIGYEQANDNTVFLLRKYPHWTNFFGNIKLYRDRLKKEFYSMLTTKVLKRVNSYPKVTIAVHIRRGDFKLAYDPNKDISAQPNPIIDQSYYISMVNMIRSFVKEEFPVTIFSDGSIEDFPDLCSLKNVKMAVDDYDIVHMLLMSQSKILILNPGSSFSLWAGFLSDGILIKHPNHLLDYIRDCRTNEISYEGILPTDTALWNGQLKRNLTEIREI